MIEADDKADVIIFQVPLPVASAIMLPPCLKNMLSNRSGTAMKAKEPARATMRGIIITRSEGLMRELVFNVVDAMVRSRGEVWWQRRPENVSCHTPTRATCRIYLKDTGLWRLQLDERGYLWRSIFNSHSKMGEDVQSQRAMTH